MKRLLIGWVMMLLAASLGVIAQEQAVDPPLPEDLPVLLDGDEIENAFEDTVTSQLFAFDGEEGDRVTITMTQGENSALDPYLVLLGPAGEVLTGDDDSGDMFLSSAIRDFSLPADGTYLILATSFNFIDPLGVPQDGLDEPQAYTLTLSGSGDESEAPALTVTQLNFGDRVEAGSDEDFPAVYYVFEAGPDDDISLTMASDDFQTVMHLFDPEGRRIAIDYTDISGVDLPAEGVYFLMATDTFFYNLPDGYTPEFTGGAFTIALDD